MGVVLRAAPGHTPGSSVTVIGEGRDALFVLGDAVHTLQLELSRPDWCFVLDDNRRRAIRHEGRAGR